MVVNRVSFGPWLPISLARWHTLLETATLGCGTRKDETLMQTHSAILDHTLIEAFPRRRGEVC